MAYDMVEVTESFETYCLKHNNFVLSILYINVLKSIHGKYSVKTK